MVAPGKKVIFYLLVVSLIATPLIACARNLSPTAGFSYSPLGPTTGDNVLFIDSSTQITMGI